MRLAVNGRNIDITPALKEYVEEKIGRIIRHNDQIMNIEVTLSVVKNPSVQNNQFVEATCFLNNAKIHVTEQAESMYASIDLLADKLDRQVKKHKDKIIKKSGTVSIRLSQLETAGEETEEESSEEDIVEIDLKTEEEKTE
ncbi:MAG: ribosome-associated translation inhibitor RaiA [bacterium]